MFGVCVFGVCVFGVCVFGVCVFGVCVFGVCVFGATQHLAQHLEIVKKLTRLPSLAHTDSKVSASP